MTPESGPHPAHAAGHDERLALPVGKKRLAARLPEHGEVANPRRKFEIGLALEQAEKLDDRPELKIIQEQETVPIEHLVQVTEINEYGWPAVAAIHQRNIDPLTIPGESGESRLRAFTDVLKRTGLDTACCGLVQDAVTKLGIGSDADELRWLKAEDEESCRTRTGLYD
jgi:hypothetical protein